MSPSAQPRYAIYYAPPANSGLWDLAQHWLGRDCESGAALLRPPLEDPDAAAIDAAALDAATTSPRHYGFHATLKAPFRLAAGTSLRDLHDTLAVFAARQAPFEAPPLAVRALGPFLALVLSEPSESMHRLAAAAVEAFEPLRAPLDEGDLQRRLRSGLTERQETLLRQWGYPYVMEEFRFHMTLTGPLETPQRERLQTGLSELFRPHTVAPFAVNAVCLYGQHDREAPFRLMDRVRLTGPGALQPAGAEKGELAE